MKSKKHKKEAVSDMKEAILHEHFSQLGKKGGRARTEALDPETRKRIARKAARARWSKLKGQKP